MLGGENEYHCSCMRRIASCARWRSGTIEDTSTPTTAPGLISILSGPSENDFCCSCRSSMPTICLQINLSCCILPHARSTLKTKNPQITPSLPYINLPPHFGNPDLLRVASPSLFPPSRTEVLTEEKFYTTKRRKDSFSFRWL